LTQIKEVAAHRLGDQQKVSLWDFANDPTNRLVEALIADLLAWSVFSRLKACGLLTGLDGAVRISAALTTFGTIKISLQGLTHLFGPVMQSNVAPTGDPDARNIVGRTNWR
jgi:hypothetical protein